MKQHRWLIGLCASASLALCLAAWSAEPAPAPPKQTDASPQAIEKQFVTFKPNFPLMPGTMDLFGYERERKGQGVPVLSPDKSLMAMTEVFYMPDKRQTYSRVFLLPVGRQPALKDILPPERIAELEAEKQVNQGADPTYSPQVKTTEVDPHAFWDRYSPQKQKPYRQTVFEVGFDTMEKYRSDLIQVADWSEDGQKLLMVYRPGVHHMGVWKTIPVVHHTLTQENVKYTLLPQLIWDDFLKRSPELKQPKNRVWDIRPLGWSSQNSGDLIVKLVVFEGQSELPAGFWRYGTETGMLQFLGDTIPQDWIARNGWLVSFTDPNAQGGPKTYGPGQTPQTEPPPPPKRTWGSRLRFWQKQR